MELISQVGMSYFRYADNENAPSPVEPQPWKFSKENVGTRKPGIESGTDKGTKVQELDDKPQTSHKRTCSHKHMINNKLR